MAFPRVFSVQDDSDQRLAYLYCPYCFHWRDFVVVEERPDEMRFFAQCPTCRNARMVRQSEGN